MLAIYYRNELPLFSSLIIGFRMKGYVMYKFLLIKGAILIEMGEVDRASLVLD